MAKKRVIVSPRSFLTLFLAFFYLFIVFVSHLDEDDPADPSNLSLSERIKLFNKRLVREPPKFLPARRLTRFQTQPITSEEVETARCISPVSLGVFFPIFIL